MANMSALMMVYLMMALDTSFSEDYLLLLTTDFNLKDYATLAQIEAKTCKRRYKSLLIPICS